MSLLLFVFSLPAAGEFETIKKAAEQGDSEAQYNLGFMYDQSVPEDKAEAVRWYRLAAEQGDATAQNNLGSIYSYGAKGVPEDDNEAIRWFPMAAERGNAKAQNNLGLMYGQGEGVPEDDAASLCLAQHCRRARG